MENYNKIRPKTQFQSCFLFFLLNQDNDDCLSGSASWKKLVENDEKALVSAIGTRVAYVKTDINGMVSCIFYDALPNQGIIFTHVPNASHPCTTT